MVFMLAFSLFVAQPVLSCGSRETAQAVFLRKGSTISFALPTNQGTSLVFAQESGLDVSLELTNDKTHFFSDSAPSRTALERVLLPANLAVGATLQIHASNRFESKSKITLWRACGEPASADVQLADVARLIAMSEQETAPDKKQTLRLQAIKTLGALALSPLSALERAQLMHNLGFLYRRESLFEAALFAYTDAEARWRALLIPLAQTNAELEIVKLLVQQKQFDAARRKSIQATAENSDSIYGSRLANDRCAIELYLGESAEQLLRCFKNAEQMAARASDDTARLGAIYNQARQLSKLGDGAGAQQLLDAMEAGAHGDSEPTLMARSYLLRALISLGLGQLDSAILQMQKTIRFADMAGTAEVQSDALRGLAQIYLQLGDPARARLLIDQARKLTNTFALAEQQKLVQLLSTEYAILSGDSAGARRALMRVFATLSAQEQQAQAIRLALVHRDSFFLTRLGAGNEEPEGTGAELATRVLRKREQPEFSAWLAGLSASDNALLTDYIKNLDARDRGCWLTLLSVGSAPAQEKFLLQEFDRLLEIGNSVQDPVVLSAWLGCFEHFIQAYIGQLAQLDPNLAWGKLSSYASVVMGGYRNAKPDRQLSAYRDLFQVMTSQTVMLSDANQTKPDDSAVALPEKSTQVQAISEAWANPCTVELAWIESDKNTGILLQRHQQARWFALSTAQSQDFHLLVRQIDALEYAAASKAYRAIGALLEQIRLLSAIEPDDRICWIEGFINPSVNWALVQLPSQNEGGLYWVQRNPMLRSVGTAPKLAPMGQPKLLFLSNAQSALPAIALERNALLTAFPAGSVTVRSRFDAADGSPTQGGRGFSLLHFSGHGASGLELDEGKLLLGAGDILGYFDLIQSNFTPEIVVLSACFGAAANAHAYVQLHPASAFLRKGARVVIAATQAIPDQQTALFFAAFYQALAQRADPVQAFHQAQLRTLQSPHLRDPRSIFSLQLWVQ